MIYTLVAWHILPERREAKYSLVAPEALALQWQDVDEWNWIRKGDATLGASRLSIEKEESANVVGEGDQDIRQQSYMLRQNLDMRAPLLGFQTPVKAQMSLQLNHEFLVSKFVAVLEAASIRFESAGFVQGRRLYMRIVAGEGDPVFVHVDLKEPLSLLAAAQPLITRHFDMTVGDSHELPIMDPLGGSVKMKATVTVAARETIEVDGVEFDTYRIESRVGDITRSRWALATGPGRGVAVRAELLLDLLAERSTKLDVLRRYSDLGSELPMPEFDIEDYRAKSQPLGASAGSTGLPLEFLGGLLGGN
jgi:hypothetical protein